MTEQNQEFTVIDEEDVLARFERFKSRVNERFHAQYERMRVARGFLSGETQWDEGDNRYISEKRNRLTVNVVANNVASTANSYDEYPFQWYTGEWEKDQALDKFLGKPGNCSCSMEALKEAISVGLGVMCVGTEDSGAPAIYTVPDFERVMLDPDSYDLTGEDMCECALIDYRGRSWIRLHYGEEYLPNKEAMNIVPCKPGLIPVVTYYVMEEGGVRVYELVNQRVIDKGLMQIPRIPVFPVYGEIYIRKDGERAFRGIPEKAKDIQRLVNYAYTQLGERLSLSPKPQFIGTVEAFKDLDDYYKQAAAGINPMLPYNRKSKDRKDDLQPPQRFDMNVQFQDLAGIIGETLGLMGSVTGVDSRGMADATQQKTATEVDYTAHVFAANVRHYYTHLKFSFKAMGQFIADMVGMDSQIEICQGPDEMMQRQVARQELGQLLGVAEPNQKGPIINAILQSHPDNEILGQLYAELNSIPQPTMMEQQMQQTIEQMKLAIEERDEKMKEMQDIIDQYDKSTKEQDKNIEFELAKMKLQHQYDLEDKIVDAQLDSGTDTEKVANEAERARIKVESEAETAAIKAQSAKDKLVFQRLKNGIDLEKAQIDNQVQIDKGNIEVAKSAALANQAVKNARKKGKKEIENAD
jgi:hypothetical protein